MLITMGEIRENNTVAGGPGYPDTRGRVLYNKLQIESLYELHSILLKETESDTKIQ